jgi:hypothetical protein
MRQPARESAAHLSRNCRWAEQNGAGRLATGSDVVDATDVLIAASA